MIIVGIDPGLSGAVAVINTGMGTVEIHDTPTEQIVKAKGKKTDYLPANMAALFRVYSHTIDHAFVEKVSAMPGQGVTSMFGFGKGFGIWQGVLAGLGIPYTLVIPQRWKKEIMEGLGDKEAAIGRALQLYPQVSELLSVKRGIVTKQQAIGRADALLIAEYGRRTIK